MKKLNVNILLGGNLKKQEKITMLNLISLNTLYWEKKKEGKTKVNKKIIKRLWILYLI